MKKMLFLAVVSVMLCTVACSRAEQVIAFEQMPAASQTFVKNYFPGEQVSYVTKDREGLGWEYEVKLANGTSLDFDDEGELISVDCKSTAVPDGIVPTQVTSYVGEKFPNAFIAEWGRDGRRWKAELSNGLELIFDKSYNFVGLDD